MLKEPKEQNFSLAKILKKYPTICVDDSTLDTLVTQYQTLIDKVQDAESINHTYLIPPLFPAYVIQMDPSPDPDAIQQTDYILVYYETPEQIYMLYFMNGKKTLSVEVDLNDIDSDYIIHNTIQVLTSAHISDSDSKELEALALQIPKIVFAISHYMLYYSPDLEYILPGDKQYHTKKSNRPTERRDILLRSKKKKYLISRDLPHRNPANYKTPSWIVRGHYRRVGKNKVLRFIAPTVAYRKELREKQSEPTPSTYRIKQ